MKAVQLWQEYKKANNSLSFVNWVDVYYPEVNIQGFYNRFTIEWIEGVTIFSSLSFIVWLCRTYRGCDLDFYELW